jgi:carbon-monoxide dehydrogenase medium subunit
MIPSSFDYSAPETISEALKLLAAHPESKLLAGGQSLIPLLKLRLAAPEHLIDLARVPDLHFIAETGDVIRIGAMTTHHQIESSDLLREKCPLLAATAGNIGDVQVRNRGTIGGSVAHADPAADYPGALLALEAKVKVIGAKGGREIAIEDFLVDALTTALEPGEIVTEIIVPVETKGAGTAYRTLVQPASGFAIVGVGVRLAASGGKISLARIGITGVAAKPYRARAVEKALEGQAPDAAVFAEAALLAAEGVEALTDMHAAADYRSHLAAVETRRTLEDAATGLA